ncbi:MAG: hypothetical protein M3R20_07395 [Pseudomonadota bacterium]|nr:hypothetical protein [Pseudomonadota bacterium]
MCASLVFATVLDQWRDARVSARGALLLLGGSAGATALVAFVGGLFRGGDHPYRDYGVFSFNLLSPFVPLDTSLAGRWFGTQQPSLPGIFQSEAMSYLGMGILALCIFAAPSLRNWRYNLHRHQMLLATLAVLMILAISNRVGIGTHELVTVPLPEPVIEWMSVFRAARRFVWVAIYALLVALLAAVCARYPRGRSASLIVASAALLQIADLSPMLAHVRRSTATASATSIDTAQWTRLVQAHRRIFQFPSLECGGLYGDGVPGARTRELEVDLIAARNGISTNSTYLARNIRDCAREHADAANNHDRPGVLYLYRSSEDIGEFLLSHGVDMTRCGYLDDVAACSRDVDTNELR